jgi:uncharacterized OsmC-like protein
MPGQELRRMGGIMNVRERQVPIRAEYVAKPAAAMVTDCARTTGAAPTDALHTEVMPMPERQLKIPVGVHRAVGGLHDAPTPGDLLCAALAACQDSTFRMVANIMGVGLEALTVEVTADVDVRGTLLMEREVPIGFQAMRCEVHYRAQPGVPRETLANLEKLAERCCIVRQTLKKGVPVTTTFVAS